MQHHAKQYQRSRRMRHDVIIKTLGYIAQVECFMYTQCAEDHHFFFFFFNLNYFIWGNKPLEGYRVVTRA